MHSGVQPADSGVHRIPDRPIVRRLYVHADHLPDFDRNPVRIDALDGALLITGHTGLLAVDIVPHVIPRLDDPHLRAWLDIYGAYHVATAHVRHDWMSALQPWLWMPVCRATVPESARWPGL